MICVQSALLRYTLHMSKCIAFKVLPNVYWASGHLIGDLRGISCGELPGKGGLSTLKRERVKKGRLKASGGGESLRGPFR